MGSEIQELEASGGYSSGNDLEFDLSKGDDLKVFSYASIRVATNDFSSENKLGQGGFGPVFKVTLLIFCCLVVICDMHQLNLAP